MSPYALFCLAVLVAPTETDGVALPEQVRGDMTARLVIHSAEAGAQPGAPLVRLTLTVMGGPLLEVEPPRLSDPVNAWEAVREDSQRQNDSRLIWTESIQLRQVKPGPASLPDVKVRFRDDPAAPFEDAEWIDLLKMVRDVPPPEALPPVSSQLQWLPWTGLAAVGLALTAAGWVIFRRWSRARRFLPPDQLALQELTRLQQASITTLNMSDCHILLSDVVRRYLTDRFALPAMRQTTGEFLASVRTIGRLSAEHQALLGDFLERCDLAKFAPVGASPEEWREATALARAFVEQTAGANGSAGPQ
ncbi:MAG TPA: hypothetical protein DDY78_27340 [Planctomycetales bacterium]|jgi:hypothetical protein|nr:hypothetical protein [Planctomycetales bacterium]